MALPSQIRPGNSVLSRSAARRHRTALVQALGRLWGRDVMLYTGGASFFALLAMVPILTLVVSLYSLLTSPAEAVHRAAAVVQFFPVELRQVMASELSRLATAPGEAVSAQGGFALVIGAYAAHRGFKALLAGLSFVHGEENQRGFVGFNLVALFSLIGSVVLIGLVSAAFLAVRLLSSSYHGPEILPMVWFANEWIWATGSIMLALTLIYRFAMSRSPVAWRASLAGGAAATVLSLVSSSASAFYVQKVAHLGATYGSLAAAVVLLIWVSWTINAVFFGGALATEVEQVLDQKS